MLSLGVGCVLLASACSADDPVVDAVPITVEVGDDETSDGETSDAAPPTTPTEDDAPAPSTTEPSLPVDEPCDAEPSVFSRTDVTASGNRLAPGVVDLTTPPLELDLGQRAAWVLSYPADDGPAWYVGLESGDAFIVRHDGTATPSVAPPGGAPPAIELRDGAPQVVSAYRDHDRFENPLPDTRVVSFDAYSAALVEPTDRYGHDVLGDAIEAAAVQILNECTGESVRIDIESPSVIEGISPMLADLDGDGTPEVLVTTSNDQQGARLESYRVDGSVFARSDPIGQGFRWRNQLGVAPLGPDGSVQVVDVRIPHIGGVVEFFTVDGATLRRDATATPYTSHVIDSGNLDMGLLVDTTGDERPEVVLVTQDRDVLVALERTVDGVEEIARTPLRSTLATNIAVGDNSLAVGTADGRLLIFGTTG